ncbi:MAG: ADP-glyceromanno-heptose 6-epimerase [Ignavibacterium sp.]|jgi:ADP-L-glycero-D-manno-heptose 6-epimerase|nr:MAG: ADP-glyceromanno-heptose 6-epimerase [Ignavibacterium sp.]MDD5608539.1 ADP-glyceromanno-heptose 6-epimerase [Ignavibacterium sp.]MDX9713326.1 ADP-glyceromanno-heptose 6-epimerase [Ignavibacteriaceae bacterium]MEB2354547.1 ADP-glyceromanno-heptose 6-epimerase [Ignavibacteriales bacterium]GIK21444.1 MAG: ADP-L-glycero-D-manno-heptose-6-epimerase [Ignavibacteriota bacterium]
MIVVTGGAGFIGSAIVWKLNQLGKTNIIVVDELGKNEKWKNLVGLKYRDFVNKLEFIEQVLDDVVPYNIEAIIHMGANSSTTEKDADHLLDNNFHYTKELSKYCVEKNIRFIYASSAATYGDGSLGFDDDESKLEQLRPLNMYGYSKHLFDLWAKTNHISDRIAGIKYFNVYGPNEYHKGDMRSVVHKAFEQIRDTGKVCLFKSLNPKYKDGEQMRDFVYVKDAVDMTLYFLDNPNINGIFNAGAGKARTWNDLVTALFNAVGKPVNIEYIDLPAQLKEKYQYFTEANLIKIKDAGYNQTITSLEDGIYDYVKNYLLRNMYLGS